MSTRTKSSRGMTLVELCIVIVILGILLTTSVAALVHARVAANESSAVAMLRTITKAQFAFANECGRGYYAASLDQLGVKKPGRDQSYLGDDLGLAESPERNGYRFNIRVGADSESRFNDCNGTPTRTTYYASAVPVAVGRTGTRSFATSQSNGIWRVDGGVAPAEPFGPPSEYVK